MTYGSQPWLTVVTITYDNDDQLVYTLNSLADDASEVEHIVVDGAQKDTTVAILKSYHERRGWLRWISEPDKGIYDAMNKGLRSAKGEYVIFMNAGDGFYNHSTVLKILGILRTKEPDVIYGETMHINEQLQEIGLRSKQANKKFPDLLSVDVMKEGMMICHQSFVARKSLAPDYALHNLSADYGWMIEVIRRSKVLLNFDGVMANYLVGGVSKQRHMDSLRGRFYIMVQQFGWTAAIFSHIMMIKKAVSKSG